MTNPAVLVPTFRAGLLALISPTALNIPQPRRVFSPTASRRRPLENVIVGVLGPNYVPNDSNSTLARKPDSVSRDVWRAASPWCLVTGTCS